MSPLAPRSIVCSLLRVHFLSELEKRRCLISTERASGESDARHPDLDHASLLLQENYYDVWIDAVQINSLLSRGSMEVVNILRKSIDRDRL